jgi:hypothetical protein|tara:strand:+ start:443 stop:631 length:189 start_codon:yes stop_codon:yes gene_type:complete
MEKEARLYDLESRLNSHEARCEERDKTMFNRLDNIERTIRQHTVALLAGMGGLIITLLMRGS